MKHALLFFAGLLLSFLAFAQSNVFGNEDHIKITAAKDTLHISFKDKSLRLNDIHDLDSCLKMSLPMMPVPVVDLETFTGMTPEYHRAIIVVLDKYRIPVVSEKAFSAGPVKLMAFRRADSISH
jgi:hypothetical protein